ncbi:DUF4236 domain-containing protein [Actinomadura sp. LOL_016]|uniref:DUF4236 domain-containing protein n=1 Tax=unclassified Actinomadura TaxID=2626254 RepID=UPI00174D7F3E|nr:hypothetical protein GCM10010182_28600 [Actinomadura cremea]
MGWHYRKSIRLGPFRLNLSRAGAGHSVGARGARYTRSAHGRRYLTFRVPGTGLSWRRPLRRRTSARRTTRRRR